MDSNELDFFLSESRLLMNSTEKNFFLSYFQEFKNNFLIPFSDISFPDSEKIEEMHRIKSRRSIDLSDLKKIFNLPYMKNVVEDNFDEFKYNCEVDKDNLVVAFKL